MGASQCCKYTLIDKVQLAALSLPLSREAVQEIGARSPQPARGGSWRDPMTPASRGQYESAEIDSLPARVESIWNTPSWVPGFTWKSPWPSWETPSG
jgi:hypothetical protein